MPRSRWTRLVIAALLCVSSPAAARLAELSFDDEADGMGPLDGKAQLNNMEAKSGELGVGALTAKLTGTARRSAFGAGHYGRAAEFTDGQGTIAITGWSGIGTKVVTTSLWLKPASLQQGRLVELQGSFALIIEQGALTLEVVLPGGQKQKLPYSGTLSVDNQFHHLALVVNFGGTPPTFSLAIDFQKPQQLASAVEKPPADPVLTLGQGYQGLLDELLIAEGAPTEDDLFDISPSYCPAGYVCSEEVLASTPVGFPHVVPIRFKSLYDPTRCGPGKPCPLVFDASGGNDCGDDYQYLGDLKALAELGFLVVTVDPYCEGGPGSKTTVYPTETSQLITLKNHLFSKSPLQPLIAGTTYSAAGCSHGAGLVTAWFLYEQDIPSRTYARSAGIDGACAMASGQLCPQVQKYREELILKKFGTADYNDPRLQAAYKKSTATDQLTTTKVRGFEFALSWGVNLQGNICNADGSQACMEEGLWGMNYGARRFRDYWSKLEEPGKHTGYFVEDRGADCRHCAPPTSEANRCGRCFLKNGRAAMATACPECLGYQSSDIGPGKAAEQCTLAASWYQDPLFSPARDGARDLGRDGKPRDGGPAGDQAAPVKDASGCRCSTASSSPPLSLVVGVGLGMMWLRRRRAARRRHPAR